MSTPRKLLVVGLMAAFAVGSTVWFASGSTAPSELGTVVGPGSVGITATLPSGWSGEVTSEDCCLLVAQLDEKAAKDEPEIVTCDPGYSTRLLVRIAQGPASGVFPPTIERPAHFTRRTGKSYASEGGDTCDMSQQLIAFRGAGRYFAVFLSIGPAVTDAQRLEAYSILDSLDIE